ncbi:MAG TPA: hypothetical protein VIT20_00730 [Propionibacteriaceae bacterium]
MVHTPGRALGLPVVPTLLLVAALAACSGPSNASPAAPTSDPTGVVSSGPMPAPTGPAPTPGTNSISPEPAVDLRKERWTEASPVTDSALVRVQGNLTGGPPCAVIGKVDVSETASDVTITVWVGRRADADCSGPQPDLGYPYAMDVALDEPLGQRTVRDGAA